MLSLSYGKPGCGKSSQLKNIAAIMPNTRYLCLEYKDKEMLDKAGINYTIIEKFNDQFLEDALATLDAFEREVHEIIHTDPTKAYKNVIVDGVSDLRKFATEEWIYKDNIERKRRGMPERETISGENKGAWADVNDRVKHLLRPLINWANVTRNNVFFTAQMKDNYLNDKKIGQVVNIGEWCEYDVDVKLEFTRPALDKYVLNITKLPEWAVDNGVYEITLQKDGLFPLLIEKGLIKCQ